MKTYGTSKSFLHTKDIAWEIVGEGVKRKIMGYDDKIMLVHVAFDKGGIGPMHQHPHSQVTYVASVHLRSLSMEKPTLCAKEIVFIPTNALHGAVCTEAGELIDVFSPIREDFMENITPLMQFS